MKIETTSTEIFKTIESLKKQTSFNKILRDYKNSKYDILGDELLIDFSQERRRGNIRYNQALEDIRQKLVKLFTKED